MAKPAVPAKVRLRMRFLKADGNPLANTLYRVRWGSDQAPPTPVAQTTTDGWVDEVLKGAASRGVVEFGEYDPANPGAKSFLPRLRVDVVLVKPPGPAPKHKRPNEKDDPNGSTRRDLPTQGGGSVAPKSSTPEDPDSKPSKPPPPPVPPPGLISMPPDNAHPDFRPEGRGRPKLSEMVKDPPVDLLLRLEKLDRMSSSLHEKRVRVFHLAWRLHNLGYLCLPSAQLTFPIDGGKYEAILDAVNRYAYKNGLELLWESDLLDPGDSLTEVWDHIEAAHDTL